MPLDLLPTKDGITITPSVWLALVREIAASDQAFDDEKVFVISRTVSYFLNCCRKCDLYHKAKLFSAKGLSSQIFDSSFHAKRNGMEYIQKISKSRSRRKLFQSCSKACFLKLLRKEVLNTFLLKI
ncbi:hypothetical protein TNCV_1690201 [Trichonephila clavipes]|nr:hypothetical protein TNCV_1690201 [Trichonephila clavipes]